MVLYVVTELFLQLKLVVHLMMNVPQAKHVEIELVSILALLMIHVAPLPNVVWPITKQNVVVLQALLETPTLCVFQLKKVNANMTQNVQTTKPASIISAWILALCMIHVERMQNVRLEAIDQFVGVQVDGQEILTQNVTHLNAR
jgi:hypothetical protein